MTHWVLNSTIEMESSRGSSALATDAPKCFVMDSAHMGSDSIAGNWERKVKKVREPSSVNTFLQPQNPPVPSTVRKGVANDSALKGISSYYRDLRLPLQHHRLQNMCVCEGFRWAIPPLTAVEKVWKEFDTLHSYIQTAADAAPNHSVVVVPSFVGTALVGSPL